MTEKTSSRGLRPIDVVLSLILPGLGHVARGLWTRAIVFLIPLCALGATLGLGISKQRVSWIGGPSDYWFSSGALFAFLLAIWAFAIWDLIRGNKRQDEEQYLRGYWQMTLQRFSRDPKGIIGFAIILLVLHVAIFAPFLTSGHSVRGVPGYVSPVQHAIKMNLTAFLKGPCAEYPLGSDNYGRSIIDWLIFGARVELGIAVVATLLNMLLGGFLGLLGGYFRGVTDAVLMRILEVINSIPFLVMVILVISLWPEGGITTLMLVLGIFGLQPARIIRSEVLSVRETDYVLSAKAIGVPVHRILLKYVLPNAIASLIVVTTMSIGVNIIVVAGLSFLGMGVPPTTPSWGNMLQEAQDYMRTAWWMAVYPGVAIIVTVFGFNILGDSLRDVLDPRLR